MPIQHIPKLSMSGIIGLLLIACSISYLFYMLIIFDGQDVAIATVSAINCSQSREQGNKPQYCDYLLRYEHDDKSYLLLVHQTHGMSFIKDQLLQLRFPKDNPLAAKIDHSWRHWWPLITFGMGILLFFVSYQFRVSNN